MEPPPAPRNTKKLPRSSSSGDIMGGAARKKKKKDKTGKGGTPKPDAQPAVEPLLENTTHRNVHHKDTATADGHMMAQLLNTFSPQEMRRFQSFQRASFAASVIEPWVAACIQHRTGGGSLHTASLSDCVAPGHAAEIGLIVAVAAKIYAQRLVAHAVRQSGEGPLLATAVYTAARQGDFAAGLFIPTEPLREHACPTMHSSFAARHRRDAALAAQETYDAEHPSPAVEETAMSKEEEVMDVDPVPRPS